MRRIPWWMWSLMILVGLALIPIGAGLILRWQGQRDLAAIESTIRATGSPVTAEEWVARMPPQQPAAVAGFRDAVRAFGDKSVLGGTKAWLWWSPSTAAPQALRQTVTTTSASRARLRTALAVPGAGWGMRHGLSGDPRRWASIATLSMATPDLLTSRNAATSLTLTYRIDGDDLAMEDLDRLSDGLGGDSVVELMIRIAVRDIQSQATLLALRAGQRHRARPARWSRPPDDPHAEAVTMFQGERIMNSLYREMAMAHLLQFRWQVWRWDAWYWAFAPADTALLTHSSFAMEQDPGTIVTIADSPWPTATRPMTDMVLINHLEVMTTVYHSDAMLRAHRILADLLDRMPAGADATAAIAALPQPHPLLAPGPHHMALGIRALDARSVRIAPLPDGPWPPGMDRRYESAWSLPRPANTARTGPIQHHGGAVIDLDLP